MNTHILSHRFAYLRPNSLNEALALLKEHPDAKVLAGGTNLIVDMKLGKAAPAKVIDITFVPEMRGIEERSDGVWIGALTTIRELAVSRLLWTSYTALAEAAAAFGSTQVAMRGTLGGNVCNGSPASDTVPALLAFGAEAYLMGPDGERTAVLGDLLAGPGQVKLRKGEILAAVRLPKVTAGTGSAFLKISRVHADLAKVSAAVRLTRDEGGRAMSVRIELGSVGPTVVRARKAEAVLAKQPMSDEVRLAAAEAAASEIQPIDDVRSTADYRRKAAMALVHDAAGLAWDRAVTPVKHRLRGSVVASKPRDVLSLSIDPDESVVVRMTVNGEETEVDVAPNDLLLNVLREHLELTGSKYGCGIGECGACTVWMNGTPVLGCLVLAVSADGAEVRTIEGEAADGRLTALQQAFIDENAFQCGYCTPGMLLMSKRLLEEIPQPTEDEIRDYLKGNHCRCTGYASIVRAVIRASSSGGEL
ncbi:MAG: FAD binding domain-containing protein [Candidatus Bipolaricaulis sp.]|nr:FAD binding domain-containing protein [Candidatus Bipolaricaulis sp.]